MSLDEQDVKIQEPQTVSGESHSFQASVGKLLDIVAHALYSEREVFLRELISNAADACDRLRYRAIETPTLTQDNPEFQITLLIDEAAHTLQIEDNGEGMTQQQLIENLGTIAHSGTEAFLKELSKEDKKTSNLIGQFGVGFYASFMVAEEVSVTSRAAGAEMAYQWISDGKDSYRIAEATRETRGTTVRLKLKKDAKEFLQKQRLSHIVKTYSNHIPFPVKFQETSDESETLNAATALWRQNKSEVSKESYTEFYRHHAHAFDEPFEVIHSQIEGVLDYAALLFVPTERPFDLFDPERACKLKLYVKRVFITDDCNDLLPSWLRFVRGVVDSQDLPLNVSRELLQNSPVLNKMKKALTKKILDSLKARATNDPKGYLKFFESFGAVLKEGLYEAFDQQDNLLPLCRFRSAGQDSYIALDDYITNMNPEQKAIYYMSGDSVEAIKAAPQLEGFTKHGLDVLCFTDPVDEFWLPRIGQYKEFSFRSITRSDVDLGEAMKDKDDSKDQADDFESGDSAVSGLLSRIKEVLGDEVAEVKKSIRLDNSPACLIASESGMDIQLEKMLKAHNRLDSETPRILEINPDHAVIKRLLEQDSADADHIWLLYDQTRILEGQPPKDAKAFSERLSKIFVNA
ncbi:MAG: molecular chaperone HtpG [Alphaproteobacteria bacterium]|nr:molecular chaperone HtpG [Alphaproteobacteria bacterium]